MDVRDIRLDILKGIGIVLVVFGHTARGFNDYGFIENTDIFTKIDFILYTTHMPLFFLIAGYNSYNSLNNRNKYAFWHSRIWSTFYPYIIWSFFLWFFKWILSIVTTINHPINATELLYILWEPISIFWFLYALFTLQLLAPLMKRTPILFIGLAISASIVCTLYNPPLDIIKAIAVNSPFFALGIFISSRNKSLFSQSYFSVIFLLIAALTFICGILLTFAYDYRQPVGATTLPMSLAGITLLISLAALFARLRLTRALAYLGVVSMPIYVLHIFVLPIVPRIFPKIGLDNVIIGLPLGTLIGIMASLMVYYVLRYLKLLDWLALSGRKPIQP